jgi:uncharacterized protein (TIGR00725 family)
VPDARPYIAVAGPNRASAQELAAAQAVGEHLGRAGAVLLTGGLGGVMEAASRGAARAGGLTVGLLPGEDRRTANEHVAVAIATGLGELRNGLLVRAVDALIAVGGAYGTLSEVALALRGGVPVIGLATWDIDGVDAVFTPQEAAARALRAASAGRES